MLKRLDKYFYVDEQDVEENKVERNLLYICIGICFVVVLIGLWQTKS